MEITKKKSGFLLWETVISSIVAIMLAESFFILYGGQFSMIQSARTALQAQQYAEIDANTLRLTAYDDADSVAHARSAIPSANGWEDEILIGAETVIDESTDSRQRIATVNVYKTGDTLSRYSLQVPLSSSASGNKFEGDLSENGYVKFPNGLILQWGKVYAPGMYYQVFYYPIPFPNNVLSVTGSINGVRNEGNWSVWPRDNATFYVSSDWDGSFSKHAWFIALGY